MPAGKQLPRTQINRKAVATRPYQWPSGQTQLNKTAVTGPDARKPIQSSLKNKPPFTCDSKTTEKQKSTSECESPAFLSKSAGQVPANWNKVD